jgi:Terminase RNaseH-like domain/Terminase large subunit, T4likevirus-type, N-terminal
MSKEIKLQLTALHPAQLQVTQQAKRFNVVCCGRRWGKTVLGMDRLIHPALQGKPVAWFAPNYRLLAEVWRELQATLGPVITRTNQQEWRIELRGGGVVEMWSLDSPDSGRGRAYSVVVVDECAMVPDLNQAWLQTIRPMLTDYQGHAWFLSTPKGMNYFKALFDRGQDPERPDWASWQMPTAGNPRIDPDEIASARLDLTEAAFSQEYLAQFVNWEGSVFRRVGEAAIAVPRTQPEAGHHYVIGCDWGRSNDYTVFVVLDTTARTVVAMDRSNRVDYALQCGRLRALYDFWNPRQVIAEQNSIGQAVIEQLTRDGLRIQPFTTTNASKAQAVEALALAFERSEIRILNDAVLVSELVAYQAERLPSGLMRYGAPCGQHDDCVMALAIAWSMVCGQHRAVYPVSESDLIVQPFGIPDHWPRAYGLDLGLRSTAAIWGALNRESDVLYLYREYYATDCEPLEQVAQIRKEGDWIHGVMDPVGNGRVPIDGYGLVELYRRSGLHIEPAPNLIESGILEVRQRMSSGRLKVFASLENYWEELRSYRHDERGQIVTAGAHLQDATRSLVVSGISQMRTAPKAPEVRYRDFTTDSHAWMS